MRFPRVGPVALLFAHVERHGDRVSEDVVVGHLGNAKGEYKGAHCQARMYIYRSIYVDYIDRYLDLVRDTHAHAVPYITSSR